jgi:predicted O-methyltransferase YrrM
MFILNLCYHYTIIQTQDISAMNQTIKNAIKKFDSSRDVSGNTTWNIPPEVGEFLYSMVIEKNAQIVLEIGTSTGYSALWLVAGLLKTGGHLYTVESHHERFTEAKKLFENTGITDTVTQIAGHAPEILTTIPTPIDLAFLDATKYEHIEYVKAVENNISPDGVIITDNIDSHRDSLIDYLDYMKDNPYFENTYYPIGTGLLVSRKIG